MSSCWLKQSLSSPQGLHHYFTSSSDNTSILPILRPVSWHLLPSYFSRSAHTVISKSWRFFFWTILLWFGHCYLIGEILPPFRPAWWPATFSGAAQLLRQYKSHLSLSSGSFELNGEHVSDIFRVCFTCWNAVHHWAFHSRNIGRSACYKAGDRKKSYYSFIQQWSSLNTEQIYNSVHSVLFFFLSEMGHTLERRLNHCVVEYRYEEDYFLHLHHEHNLILCKPLQYQSHFLRCSQWMTFLIRFPSNN